MEQNNKQAKYLINLKYKFNLIKLPSFYIDRSFKQVFETTAANHNSLPWNGARCHMIKPWVASWLQKVFIVVSQFQGRWQHVTRHSFEHTCRHCHLPLSQLCEVLPQRLRLVLRGGAKTHSFRCPHLKDFIGVRCGIGGGHAVVPSHPIHLPRCHSRALPDIFT
jgi:hypothetical protein